jgi:hypothetical protein
MFVNSKQIIWNQKNKNPFKTYSMKSIQNYDILMQSAIIVCHLVLLFVTLHMLCVILLYSIQIAKYQKEKEI